MGDAIVWWIALQLLGLAAVPIAAVLLRALPDRGYTLSKPLGLMLTGWLAYTVAMLKIAQFDRLLVTICLVVVAAFSLFLLLRNGRALFYELRDHYTKPATLRYVLVAEVLFALAFIIWTIVRAYNPDIVDQEKFMDYGFLNAILKSGTFPPNDQWLAGFSINYYYFGYILMAALTALSGVATQVAFNLANVALFAMTALGSFGIVHNLITSRLLVKAARAARRKPFVDEGRTTNDERRTRSMGDGRRAIDDRRRGYDREPVAPQPSGRRERSARPAQAPSRQAQVTTPVAPVASSTLPSRRTRTRTIEPEVAPTPDEIETTPDDPAYEAPIRNPQSAIRNWDSPTYLPISNTVTEPRKVPVFLSPYIYAIIAALMVVAMGNLTTMFAKHDGSSLEGNGFRFCFACNGGPGYDWFGASRVIQDYSTVNGQKQAVGFPTINEFPAFSFLLADMHPHVIALPFVLLVLGISLALAKRRVVRAGTWRDGVPPGLHAWLSIALTGLITGSLYAINTWDFPTYLLVVLACLALPYLAAGRRQGLGWIWLKPFIVQAILVGVFAFVTFLPFYLTFKSLVGGQPVQLPQNLANIPVVSWILEKLGTLVLINTADKTILGFIVIFGIFLAALLVWLGFEFYSYFKRRSQAGEEREDIQRSVIIWVTFFILTFVAAFIFKFPLLALLLPIAAVALAMVWKEPRRTERNVVLIMVAIAAIIGLGIEVVYLRDNFQMRMNTLFKFYYQIWILWALAAGYAFWRVLFAAFGTRTETAAAREHDWDGYYAPSGAPRARKALAGVWAVAFALLVLSGLMYSWYGVQARQVGNQTAMRGLDGTTWLTTMDGGQLAGDLPVTNWLKQNATGKDVVLEAGAEEYDWAGRISSYSGVPTLIAWDNSHERLWRTNQPDATQQITERRTVVNSIYSGVDPSGGAPLTAQRLLALLKQYNVDYVVVGAIERGTRVNSASAQAGEKIAPYAESLFKYALTKVDVPNAGNTDLYKVGDVAANNGTPPITPVPGATPGATGQPDLNVPPAGLFDKGQAGANRGLFNLPRGITRDAAGNFYVVDTQNERIQKFDSTGKWLAIIGSKGNGDGQFNPYSDTAVGTGPGGIAVDAAGNIYVADTWNHRIQKFDKDGNYVTAWGSFINLTDPTASADQDAHSKFYGPRGVAIGPDGNIYVTDTGNKRVAIFTPDGKFVREISSGVTPAKLAQQYPYNKDGELNEPIGIAVDKQGNVYVADSNNHRIQVFDSTGKYARQWAIPAGMWDPGPYMEPFIALDGQGNLYVTAPTGKAVLKYDPTGKQLGQATTNGTTTLQLPTGIWADPDGTIYVSDTNGNGVVKFAHIP
jgi:YYY domain-containing protein